jgi:hypothetical protein
LAAGQATYFFPPLFFLFCDVYLPNKYFSFFLIQFSIIKYLVKHKFDWEYLKGATCRAACTFPELW